jgi:polyisoprenyl-phosphate glycosyltransferase
MSRTVFPVPESAAHANRLLSVVVPVYNEEEVIGELHRRLSMILEAIPLRWEIVYVNDGSKDRTVDLLREFRQRDERVAVVDLSRNFGKEIAMTAGLDSARGDAVVVIDADLQDPPELIAEFVKYWMDGYDVVYAKRSKRDGETLVKKTTAHLFYRLIGKISEVNIPEDTGDYRLLSRRAVDSLNRLREKNRFMKGLFAWIGYHQKEVLYTRDARYAGQTKWNYWKLWNFALEGITSFTSMPLKLSTYIGFVVALGALLYAVKVIYKTLVYGDPVAGYPSLMVVILFLGGVQLITLGFMGEYLARVFEESKQRPLYLIKNYLPSVYGHKAIEQSDTETFVHYQER